jgi:hypothetical protein
LVLTESGADLATQVFVGVREKSDEAESRNPGVTHETNGSPSRGNGTGHAQAALKPKWDARRRELRIGGQLVKRYRVPAASQEAVLSAFEEESWPAYIDDPLPGVADGVPKQRLHNAIKRLNDHQTNYLIHFHGNGNGEGIGWALVSDGRTRETRQARRIGNGRASQRG